jgi:hypothetical protein
VIITKLPRASLARVRPFAEHTRSSHEEINSPGIGPRRKRQCLGYERDATVHLPPLSWLCVDFYDRR